MSYLRLTPGQATNQEGLLLLRLALWDQSREIDHVTAVSGQPGRQVLRRAIDSLPKSLEPIPEGEYTLGDPDADHGVNWASGQVGDLSGNWGAGLGPVWIGIHPSNDNPSRREALGIHLDANESYSPGTSGCLGIQGTQRLQRLLEWFSGPNWPRRLQVDWGLGTVVRGGR